ncbi:MAG: signal recognition particle-docking protein FtsY [Chloroflexi bacterium]|nr:signal recognition particle-docking protein FtsY [Chloroflexota bacterium]
MKKSKDTWFGKIQKLFDRSTIDDTLWEEMEQLLISADVGVGATEELIGRTREKVKQKQAKTGSEVYSIVKEEIVNLLNCSQSGSDNRQGLHVVMVVGANGVGKTTSIAKLANNYKKEGKSVIIAAADTFRAAAIDQLKIWGQRIGIEIISHQSGGDPGAVVFDAISAAVSRKADVLIIDTAGRLHTKTNLMEEIKKINRVIIKSGQEVHEVLLILDATTGQNGLAQAKYFTEAVGVDGIILTKLDGTAKGGIVLAICKELRIPILYIGTGQSLDDLIPFNARSFAEALFS